MNNGLILDIDKYYIPLITVSFYGAYLFDLIDTNITIFSDIETNTKRTFLKFIPNIVFIAVPYLIFNKYFNETIAWMIGVPIGIALYSLFISCYYFKHSNPSESTTLTSTEAFTLRYVTHFFNFMFAWLLITVASFITQYTNLKGNQSVVILIILVIGILSFLLLDHWHK